MTLIGVALAGCGFTRNVGVADRCVDVMTEATPGASIDVTERRAVVKDGVATADVAGVQQGKTVAAECQFQHEVLTSFRWRREPFAEIGSGSSQPSP